jgi:IS30 family transposase
VPQERPLDAIESSPSNAYAVSDADERVNGKWDLLPDRATPSAINLFSKEFSEQVPSKDTAVVVAALSRHVRRLPASLRCLLTWDRGLEMPKHKSFTVDTKVKVYFCDLQSPWQRGSSENTKGLLRQYFPKRMDLSGFSQSELDKVAQRLNQRPRKTLGFETPASRLRACVASTH